MSDRDDIERVAGDYIEAWFTGDAPRMRAALHPELAKRSVEHPDGAGLALDSTAAQEMVEGTAEGRGMRYPQGHEVHICDVDAGMASVKLTSAPYTEYLHLARFGDRWLIVNVLWRRRDGDVRAR